VFETGFWYPSDERLKKDVKRMDDVLSKVLQLKSVSFKWKKDNKESFGLIAQDVERVFPELVATNNETGLKAIDYGKIVAPLIGAINEQQEKINEQQEEIEGGANQQKKLQKEINELRNEIEKLKKEA
jgi:hypothetical protein